MPLLFEDSENWFDHRLAPRVDRLAGGAAQPGAHGAMRSRARTDAAGDAQVHQDG